MARTAQMKPLPEWHAYKWNDGDHIVVKRRLRSSRDEIAAVLEIGIHEMEARVTPGPGVEIPPARSFDAYMDIRNDRSNVEVVSRIDIIIDDLAVILIGFLADLENVNALASDPKAYRTLELVANRSELSEEEIEFLDPRVRELLAVHYPGGREHFAPGKVQTEAVRAAANAALENLPRPNRGRPSGSNNQAARKLARELVSFYEYNSASRAARSVIVSKSLDLSIPETRESGMFLKFFKIAVGTLPRRAREEVTRTGGGIASLVRSALAQE